MFKELIQAIAQHVSADNIQHFVQLTENLLSIAAQLEKSCCASLNQQNAPDSSNKSS